MTASKKWPSRRALSVYRLACAGACASIIAKKLKISKVAVSKHLSKLEDYGAIRKVNPKSSPIFYTYGQKSKILDEMIYNLEQSRVNLSNVGCVPASKPQDVPHVVAHSVGATMKVLKLGDMEELIINGERRPFLRKTRSLNNGTEQWVGRLRVGEREYTVRYLEGVAGEAKMFIYLHEYTMTAQDLESAPEDLGDLNQLAQEAANVLQKYGGWRLSLPEVLDGLEPHYVVDSPGANTLAEVLGPGTELKGGVMVDKSHPKGLEIHGDRGVARKALDISIDDLNDLPTLRSLVIQQSQLIKALREELALVREYVGLEISRRQQQRNDEVPGYG